MVITLFDVGIDGRLVTTRTKLNRAFVLGEGVSPACKRRATQIQKLMDDISNKAKDPSVNIEILISESGSAQSTATLQAALSAFSAFTPTRQKTPSRAR